MIAWRPRLTFPAQYTGSRPPHPPGLGQHLFKQKSGPSAYDQPCRRHRPDHAPSPSENDRNGEPLRVGRCAAPTVPPATYRARPRSATALTVSSPRRRDALRPAPTVRRIWPVRSRPQTTDPDNKGRRQEGHRTAIVSSGWLLTGPPTCRMAALPAGVHVVVSDAPTLGHACRLVGRRRGQCWRSPIPPSRSDHHRPRPRTPAARRRHRHRDAGIVRLVSRARLGRPAAGAAAGDGGAGRLVSRRTATRVELSRRPPTSRTSDGWACLHRHLLAAQRLDGAASWLVRSGMFPLVRQGPIPCRTCRSGPERPAPCALVRDDPRPHPLRRTADRPMTDSRGPHRRLGARGARIGRVRSTPPTDLDHRRLHRNKTINGIRPGRLACTPPRPRWFGQQRHRTQARRRPPRLCPPKPVTSAFPITEFCGR